MFVLSAGSLRVLQSIANFSDGNKVEDDESSGNDDVKDGQGTSINAVEVAEQADHEIDSNEYQHDHEERNSKLGQERINFNRRVADSFVPVHGSIIKLSTQ